MQGVAQALSSKYNSMAANWPTHLASGTACYTKDAKVTQRAMPMALDGDNSRTYHVDALPLRSPRPIPPGGKKRLVLGPQNGTSPAGRNPLSMPQ